MRVSFTVRVSVRVIQVAILSCNCEAELNQARETVKLCSKVMLITFSQLLYLPGGPTSMGYNNNNSTALSSQTSTWQLCYYLLFGVKIPKWRIMQASGA